VITYRQLKTICFFCLFPLALWGTHLHWLGNYNQARQKALSENKPLMVLVVKQHDPFNRTMIRNIFMDQPYIEKLNNKTVAVIVRYEESVGYPVEMYYTQHFPTLFLVDPVKEIFLKPPLYGREITKENLLGYFDIKYLSD